MNSYNESTINWLNNGHISTYSVDQLDYYIDLLIIKLIFAAVAITALCILYHYWRYHDNDKKDTKALVATLIDPVNIYSDSYGTKVWANLLSHFASATKHDNQFTLTMKLTLFPWRQPSAKIREYFKNLINSEGFEDYMQVHYHDHGYIIGPPMLRKNTIIIHGLKRKTK